MLVAPCMKLQVKFNFVDLEEALANARETTAFADILEICQRFLLRYGIKSLAHQRIYTPFNSVFALEINDLKTSLVNFVQFL